MRVIYLIPIALLLSLLLITYDIQQVLADATIEVITPTGSGLSSASDCVDITGSNGIVWQNCNSFLYAIDYDTNIILANISIGNVFSIEACILSTCVYGHDGTANQLNKYTLSGNTILQTGQLTLTCNSDGPVLHFDALGYLWTTCSADNHIIRINPQTMAVAFLSQDLSATCVLPNRVAYSTNDNTGVVYCITGTNMFTFSITNPTTLAILDNEATGEGAIELIIDGGANRIIAVSAAIRQVWGYSPTGVLTLVSSDGTSNIGACKQEALANEDSQGIQFICMVDGGTNVLITGFISNATGVNQVLNAFLLYDNANVNGVGIDFRTNSGLTAIYYINADSNNEKWVRITNLRTIESPEPDAPDGDGGGGIDGGTGIDCDLPQNAQTVLCRIENPETDPDIVGGVDCSLPANSNTVLCRSGGNDRGNIGGAGDFIVGDGSEGTGVSGILCALGFVDCTVNDDIKTNGLGYLMFIAGVALMIGLFFMISKGDLGSIPTFIWIIGILALAGAFSLFNIIDPVVFIISIVAVVALAVPKIISTVRGGDTMGGGSSV